MELETAVTPEPPEQAEAPVKRGRGRPPGSKNKPKVQIETVPAAAPAEKAKLAKEVEIESAPVVEPVKRAKRVKTEAPKAPAKRVELETPEPKAAPASPRSVVRNAAQLLRDMHAQQKRAEEAYYAAEIAKFMR